MTLADAIAAKDQPPECIVVPFHAIRRGEHVLVTAVLKRTAIFEDHRPNERHLDLHDAFEVGELAWTDCSQPNSVAASSARGRRRFAPKRHPAEERVMADLRAGRLLGMKSAVCRLTAKRL